MQPFFITSSGTEIGKTLITTALCHQLLQKSRTVRALKPLISGFDVADAGSDSALILDSLGQEVSTKTISAISPWRFAAPLAPSMAAAKEGCKVDMQELVRFCQQAAQGEEDYLLVEGVGGVMVPLTETHTVLDWMEQLSWPVVLVVGSYLGSISHTLTAIEALRARGLALQVLVVSQSDNSGVPLADTVEELRRFVRMPVVPVARVARQERAWQAVAPLSHIVEPQE
jgi:dethiobiotin synthetase